MIKQLARMFGYDAVKASTRRVEASSQVQHESKVLSASKREKLTATAQDELRNRSLVAWMIRRHMDYVSRFRFQFKTGNEELDKAVNTLFHRHAMPRNFDICGRLGREEMFRLFELEKVTAGDAAMLKLSTGHLQAVEGDLIRKPSKGRYNPTTRRFDRLPREILGDVSDEGIIFDPHHPGRIKQFCICARMTQGGVYFDQLIDAEHVIFDAYYTRYASQVRGVSPLSTALNTIRDTYEGIDYNLAKAKIHALFGIAIMRDYAGSDTAQEEIAQFGDAAGIAPQGDDAAGIATQTQELKPGQMLTVDMDTKGRIDTIESRTPSGEFREFSEFTIRLALLALDIPFSSIDSRASSFAAMIADQNLYDVACRSKREKNLWKRKEYSDWLLMRNWSALAPLAGDKITLEGAQDAVEWVAAGFPWLQKIQEVEGDGKAIALALDNPIDAARRRGGDVFENIDKTADVLKYAKEKGVPMMIGSPGQVDSTATPTDAPTDEDTKTEAKDGQ